MFLRMQDKYRIGDPNMVLDGTETQYYLKINQIMRNLVPFNLPFNFCNASFNSFLMPNNLPFD